MFIGDNNFKSWDDKGNPVFSCVSCGHEFEENHRPKILTWSTIRSEYKFAVLCTRCHDSVDEKIEVYHRWWKDRKTSIYFSSSFQFIDWSVLRFMLAHDMDSFEQSIE